MPERYLFGELPGLLDVLKRPAVGHRGVAVRQRVEWLRGQDSNLEFPGPKPGVLPLRPPRNNLQARRSNRKSDAVMYWFYKRSF